jgi:hypothetical protein
LVFGLVLLIVGFIFLYVRFLFISQSLVLERKGKLGSIGRSWQLVRGSWWRVFGISIVLGILVFVISAVAGALGQAFALVMPLAFGTVVKTVVSSAVNIFVLPVQLGTLTLLYYDLRIRKEGFDLEQLAQSMGAAVPDDSGVWIG